MAIWQYDLELVPCFKVIEIFHGLPEMIDEDLYGSLDWWEGEQLPTNYSEVLSSFLDEGHPWSEEMKCWGYEDSHRIDVFFHKGMIQHFSIRIDVRDQSMTFLNQIAGFSAYCKCLFLLLSSGMKIMEAKADLLMLEVCQSDAFSYMNDPHHYLKNIHVTP